MVQLDYEREPVLDVVFYRTESGSEPVRVWLRSLPKEQRTLIGDDIAIVQYKWPVGMPLVRHLGDFVWEVRTSLHKTNARILFAIRKDKMLVLHGFIKKTQKTPKKEIRIAKTRYMDALRRLGDG